MKGGTPVQPTYTKAIDLVKKMSEKDVEALLVFMAGLDVGKKLANYKLNFESSN